MRICEPPPLKTEITEITEISTPATTPVIMTRSISDTPLSISDTLGIDVASTFAHNTQMGIKVTGLKEHTRANENRLAKYQDQTVLMRTFSGRYLSQINPRRFREGKAPNGKKWAPITAATERAYQIEFKGAIPGRTLMRRGDLMRSVQRRVRKLSFEVFSNHISAATHQFGRGGIVARPFIGFSKRELAAFARDTEKWLVTKEKK